MDNARYTKPENARPTIGWLTQAEVNTLSTNMWRGVDDAARERGANLLFIPGDILKSPVGYLAQANVLYDLVSAESLDGLLVWGGLLSQYISIEEFLAFCERYRPLPMVNVGMPLKGIPSVWVDNYAGMRDAVRHLIDVHGYRRIAFLRGVVGTEAEDRYRAYADVLSEHGIPFDPGLVTPPSDQQRADGVAAMRLLLDERRATIEAVVASTDALALGAMDVLRARRMRVPDDVKVVGFDDVEEAAAITPPLSTVRQPLYELTRRAADMLLAQLAGEEVPERVVLDAEFVVRQSCGCLDTAIVQAVTAPLTQVPKEPSAPESFEAALGARRQEILSDMRRAMGRPSAMGAPSTDLDPAPEERLLDAFSAEALSSAASESPAGDFVSTLTEILHQVTEAGGDVGVWQGALSALRHHVLPCMPQEHELLLRTENLWQQARVVIASAAERARAYRALQTQHRADMLQEVSQSLLTTVNVEELADAIARELPGLGIPSCYLSLYQNPEAPAEWSRLVLAHDKEGRAELGEEGLRFPSRQLAPGEVFRREDRYAMSLEPLYFRKNQFGFALLEVSPHEAEIREPLRQQFSSALQRALLVREMENRALQLQTTAEVSHAASSILEPDDLIQEVVELIRDRFGLYYTGLFLVDQAGADAGAERASDHSDGTEPGQWAVLRAGTGKAGRQMVMEGHRLKVGGASMIGQCVADGQARIALDVGEEAARFDNPLLPETRSEMALPLIARGQVVGALTVQSEREAAFSEEDISSLQMMALQVAVALENARLLQRSRQAVRDLAEERRLLRTLIDSLPDYVFVKDAESRFVINNVAHLQTLGASAQGEVVGKTDYDIFPQELATQYHADEQAVIQSGQLLDSREEPTVTQDGTRQWLLTTKVPLRDTSGKVTGLVGISRDITEIKEAERALERRNTQLQAAAEISRAASSILDVEPLLEESVNLIRDQFDYYYVGLFLVDEDGKFASLRAGTGEAGRTMLEGDHRLEIGGHSMIGRCIAEKQARIALDVGEEAEHFENPLLPETRSETALPLISREETLGALTVQSAQEAAFSDDDIAILQAMADQLANAIENARLYDQTQRELAERTRAEQALAQEQYLMNALMDNLPDTIYFKDLESRFVRINKAQADRFHLDDPVEAVGKTDFDFFTDEHARPAFEDELRIIRTAQPLLNLEERETWPDRPDTWVSTTKLPLYDEEGKIVGTFGSSRDITARRQAEEVLRRRSTQLQAAAEVSQVASSILDVEVLEERSVNLIRDRFDYYYVGLFLMDEAGRFAILRAGTGEAGQTMLERTHQFEVGGRSMIGQCVADGQARIALDVGEEAVRFDNPLLPETRSELALPLISRGEVIGAVTVQSAQEAAFTEEDISVLQTMASQVATAIENANLLERTQTALAETEDQAHRLAVLNQMSEQLSRVGTVDQILDTSAVRISQIVAADQASVALLTEEGDSFEVLTLQGEAGAVRLESRLPVEGTMLGMVVRENHLIVTSDTRTSELVDLVSMTQQGILSTMSVPLSAGGRVIGTLNVGSTRPNAYTQRDESLLLQAATLLSSAIENRRLLEQTQTALRELEAAQRRYMRLAWADYTSAKEAIRGYVRAGAEEGPADEDWLPQMTAAVEQADTVIGRDEDGGSVLAIPLRVHGEVIGALGGFRPGTEGWDEDDIASVEAIVEQMALALDNERLFEEEKRARQLLDYRVKELDCLSDIGQRLGESPPVAEFLEWVTERVPSAMQHPELSRVAIDLEGQVYGAAEAPDLACQIVQSLRVGGERVGRLVIAYTEERDFLDEESSLLGDITRRIGGYIENRRLFEETQAALAEVEDAHRSYLRQAWEDHLRQQAVLEQSGFLYDQLQAKRPEDAITVPDLWLPEMARALAEDGIATVAGGGEDGQRTGLAMPITIRGETIGVLGVEAPTSDHLWTEEDRALIEAVSEQLAQALESARLFADTQRRAERERLVGEITAKVRASTDVREILKTTAIELGQALGASRALVRLGPEEPTLDATNGATEPVSQPMDDEPATGEESE